MSEIYYAQYLTDVRVSVKNARSAAYYDSKGHIVRLDIKPGEVVRLGIMTSYSIDLNCFACCGGMALRNIVQQFYVLPENFESGTGEVYKNIISIGITKDNFLPDQWEIVEKRLAYSVFGILRNICSSYASVSGVADSLESAGIIGWSTTGNITGLQLIQNMRKSDPLACLCRDMYRRSLAVFVSPGHFREGWEREEFANFKLSYSWTFTSLAWNKHYGGDLKDRIHFSETTIHNGKYGNTEAYHELMTCTFNTYDKAAVRDRRKEITSERESNTPVRVRDPEVGVREQRPDSERTEVGDSQAPRRVHVGQPRNPLRSASGRARV